MKKLAFILTILLLVIISSYLVITMPHRFYYTFQSEGIQSEYLSASSNREILLRGLKPYQNTPGRTNFWKSVHFNNFQLDIPFDDVSLQIFPRPNMTKSKTFPDFDIIDHNFKRVANVSGFKVKMFDTAIPLDRIFNLPITTLLIKKRSPTQIWLDVLNLDIRLKDASLTSWSGIKKTYKRYPLYRLGYFLYIYKLRDALFLEKFDSIKQNGPFHIVFEKELEDNKLLITNMFYLNGRFYEVDFTFNKNHNDYSVALKKLMKNLRLSPSRDEESSLEMYTEFRSLKFSSRSKYKGMALLYSAWSHELENSKFFKEMIYYLESGNYDKKSLFSLYEFSKRKYGRSYSQKDEILRNDLEAKIEREAKKEQLKRDNEISNLDDSDDEAFKSESDKMDYILKNIKTKKNKDDISDY